MRQETEQMLPQQRVALPGDIERLAGDDEAAGEEIACFFFQAEDGIRDLYVTGVQPCALPIFTLDVPDTPDNEKKFGRPSSRTGQGGAFPQVRVVGLGECGTHAIVAAELGPIATGERELAAGVLADLEPGMLVSFDRGFYSY